MLVLICGLPGVGKTTICQQLAPRLEAFYLRIDTIEHAIRASGVLRDDVGPAGYDVGCALATTNLTLGRRIVAECVNPLKLTRDQWRAAAGDYPIFEVELICSDSDEHRRRVESRLIDIPGFSKPDWASVVARHWEPWPDPSLQIDTAHCSAADAVETILATLNSRQSRE